MKQIKILEPGKILIEEKDGSFPICAAGEALLKVQYCGICGADVASYTGNQPFTTYPRIPGHEFSAEIVALPEGYSGQLKVGNVVTANPYFNCGGCVACRDGHLNCCHDNRTMGVQRDGSFAEYIAMPVERIYDGCGLDAKTLALIEPFSIGWHALTRVDFEVFEKRGRSPKILVIGAGPIGLFALISAKRQGAACGAKVYSADLLDGRLELAQRFGADGTVNTKKKSLQEFTREITGEDGFDICVEACGAPETFLEAIEYAAYAGEIVLIGNGKRPVSFVHSILLKKELNVHGSRNSLPEDFRQLIRYVAEGGVDLSPMISGVYPAQRAEQAFQALLKNDGSLCKLLIQMGGEVLC